MAFYDASQSSTQLSPLQRGLLLPPDAILSHQDLLQSICSEANFSDEKAEYILDILLKNIKDNISYNNISQSTTSLYILDYCIRNGTIFGQYVFGRYILQKLYILCCKKLTQVSSNHKSHQQFQYQLIGTILEWHRMYSNQPGSTLNYTFSRLQKSGILALYQSYKQTQNLYNQNNNAKSHSNKSESPPNLPPSPQPPQTLPPDDEKQMAAANFNAVRGRSMTTNPSSQPSDPSQMQTIENRARSLSAQDQQNMTATPSGQASASQSAVKVETLIHRDGRVKLEYTEKFITEINQLIARFLKPTREVLSRQRINLADKKLQKYLQILQVIQQRLVKVISEVKNDDSIVSLAIKANDCIVSTILWFNSLVKKSKHKGGNNAIRAEKGSSVSKNVMENIDLVGLEQQLLLDNANLFKRKQMRDLKEQKDRQQREQQLQAQQLQAQMQQQQGQEPSQAQMQIQAQQPQSPQIVNNGNIPQEVAVTAPQQQVIIPAMTVEDNNPQPVSGDVEVQENQTQQQQAVDIVSEPVPVSVVQTQPQQPQQIQQVQQIQQPQEVQQVIQQIQQPQVINNNNNNTMGATGGSAFGIDLNDQSQGQQQSNVNVNMNMDMNVNNVNNNNPVNISGVSSVSLSSVNDNDNDKGDVVDLLNMNVDDSGQVINNNDNVEDTEQAIQEAIDSNIALGVGSGVTDDNTNDNEAISNMIAQVNQTEIVDNTTNAEDANRM